MLQLTSINYDHQDLINLIKNNTAALLELNYKDLFVELKIKNNRITAKVFRPDGKILTVNLQNGK
jgi:hypothetical protein